QANTEENRQAALASLSSKVQKNQLLNNEIQREHNRFEQQLASQERAANTYATLFPRYTFDDEGNIQFVAPETPQTFSPISPINNKKEQSKKSTGKFGYKFK